MFAGLGNAQSRATETIREFVNSYSGFFIIIYAHIFCYYLNSQRKTFPVKSP